MDYAFTLLSGAWEDTATLFGGFWSGAISFLVALVTLFILWRWLEPREMRGEVRIAVAGAASVCLVGLIVLVAHLLVFTPMRLYVDERKHVTELEKTLETARSESMARVDLTRTAIAPLGTSDAEWPFVNVHYTNSGNITATHLASNWMVAIAPAGPGISPDGIQRMQDALLALDRWPSDMAESAQRDFNPRDGKVTSIPDRKGKTSALFLKEFDGVFGANPGQAAALYIVIAFKYRDANTPENMVRVTEYCWWFQGNQLRHECGRGRTFLESLTP